MFNWYRVSLIIRAAVFLRTGRGGGGSSSSETNNNPTPDAKLTAQQQALTDIANAVIPVLQNSNTQALSLANAIDAYCDEVAVSSANVASTLATAQSTWQAAMTAWQQAEVMNFGPSFDGGNNSIRERIYSWPAKSSCFVDGALVDYDDDTAGFDINSQTPRRIGLDALEYLLYSNDLDHTCSTDSSTTSPTNGAWNIRTDADRSLARCEYAKIVANDVAAQTTALLNDWQGAGDNYFQQLSTAGSTSSRYSSATEALNEISDALFYLDTEVKDMKIAEPAGISADCASTSCPETVESTYANQSLANIKANLQGFLAVLNNGMDDLLEDAGQGNIASTMTTDINVAIANIDNFGTTLVASVTGINEADCTNSTSDNRLEEACALHADVKKVTDVLKTDFVTALTLAIPQSAEGDND